MIPIPTADKVKIFNNVLAFCICKTPKAIIMISAERIKSVLIAPLTLSFSFNSEWELCVSGCKNLCRIFSMPSKHKYAPPINNY